jgi:acyl-CoA synthetase (NDP forming)
MQVHDIIRKAVEKGEAALNEVESKRVLQHYGVSIVEEYAVSDIDHAISQAKAVGFPVVLKGLGARLTHKTERGLVKLNLNSVSDVRTAGRQIKKAAGKDLEGFVVQRMLFGKRELVAGLFRDEQFGPVVMFGIGGVFTEALNDVVFRIVPLDEAHAKEMIDRIHSAKLLDSFRGAQPLNRNQMIRVLTGLSRLAIEHPEIREVDINPILLDQDGSIAAVDALILLHTEKPAQSERPYVDSQAIYHLFHPTSIAFVGASPVFTKWGYALFAHVVAGNYKGKIYLVNSKGGEIAGRPVFKSVVDIPDSVDLAIVSVPASKVLELLPQFQEKNIRYVVMVTSGFSEVGEEGKRLEQKLTKEARASGVLVLGPNTMGICNPHINFFCSYIPARPTPGSVTLISQSGNLGAQLMAFAEKEGIGIRAFVGSGNEAMITLEDYMDGLEQDDLTKILVLYVESIKDGRRFFNSARRISQKKPILMLKGGRTTEGNRAAASHTGAMASDMAVFNAACAQAGIVTGQTSMEVLDMSAVFSSLPLPAGNRVAIMTLGGGWGVVTTDLCVEHGLSVPPLPSDIIERINQILPPYWSHANPVDLVGEIDISLPMTITQLLMEWDGCDALIHLSMIGRDYFSRRMIESAIAADPYCNRSLMEKIPKIFSEYNTTYTEYVVKLIEKYKKPVVGVRFITEGGNRIIMDVQVSTYKGVVFNTPERAVKALASMYSYKQWLDSGRI